MNINLLASLSSVKCKKSLCSRPSFGSALARKIAERRLVELEKAGMVLYDCAKIPERNTVAL